MIQEPRSLLTQASIPALHLMFIWHSYNQTWIMKQGCLYTGLISACSWSASGDGCCPWCWNVVRLGCKYSWKNWNTAGYIIWTVASDFAFTPGIKTWSRYSSPHCDRISICKCAGQTWWTCQQTGESLVHGNICFSIIFPLMQKGIVSCSVR